MRKVICRKCNRISYKDNWREVEFDYSIPYGDTKIKIVGHEHQCPYCGEFGEWEDYNIDCCENCGKAMELEDGDIYETKELCEDCENDEDNN